MIVSIGTLAYNEENTLPLLLDDLRNLDYPHDKIEILLVDSMSTDGTRRIMEDFATEDNGFYQVRIFENPDKVIPCGLNVMLDNYIGDAMVRIDAHARVPRDFITKGVDTLQRTGEMVCGGPRPNLSEKDTSWARTLLLAEQSMFGSSIAGYRRQQVEGYVSTIFHGLYRREVYDKVGKYNKNLLRSEDNDMSQRIRAAGFRLYYTPEITSYQMVRNTLPRMLKQKYQNGYWVGKTMGINPHCFSTFHFVPLLFVWGIVLTTVLALLGFPLLSLLMWGAYLTLMVIFTITGMIGQPFSFSNLLLPVIFLLMHVCYGVGTTVGLIEMPFWLRKIRTKENEG